MVGEISCSDCASVHVCVCVVGGFGAAGGVTMEGWWKQGGGLQRWTMKLMSSSCSNCAVKIPQLSCGLACVLMWLGYMAPRLDPAPMTRRMSNEMRWEEKRTKHYNHKHWETTVWHGCVEGPRQTLILLFSAVQCSVSVKYRDGFCSIKNIKNKYDFHQYHYTPSFLVYLAKIFWLAHAAIPQIYRALLIQALLYVSSDANTNGNFNLTVIIGFCPR